FLLFADLSDLLGRDHNVASFSSATYHAHDGESVGEARPEALVVFQQLIFNLLSSLFTLFQEPVFFFLAFVEDIVEFVFLVVEVVAALCDKRVCFFYLFLLGGNQVFGFLTSLLTNLDFQFLQFYFLSDSVEFAVVSYIFLLLRVFLNELFRLFRPFFVLLDTFFKFFQLFFKSRQPCFVPLYL